MTEQDYTYNITNDFPNSKVNPDMLHQEIVADGYTSLLRIDMGDGNVVAWFDPPLTVGEETYLTNVLIGTHDGYDVTVPQDSEVSLAGAPDSTCDRNNGYYVGHKYITKNTKKEYTCVDDTPNAAVWHQINKFGDHGKVAYNLVVSPKIVNLSTWSVESTFPWDNSRNSEHYAGYATIYVEIGNRNLDMRLYDSTNAVELGSLLNISSDGFYTFAITNPTSNSLIELHARKSSSGGQNPTLHSAYIEYKL
jgi:hypothetical protein